MKNATSSTRSSPLNTDVLTQHDATVKARFRRALLSSVVVNFVALSAFAVSKSAPIDELFSTQTPMQMTFSTTPTRITSSTTQAATSSTRSDANSRRAASPQSDNRIARANYSSSPRRETRRESPLANTSEITRERSATRDEIRVARRVPTENRRFPKAFREDDFATRAQNTTVKSAANRYSSSQNGFAPRSLATSSIQKFAGENAAASSARDSSASSSFSGRESSGGASNATRNTNGISSGNLDGSGSFGRSVSPDNSANAASQSAPLQNPRDESSTRTRPTERSPQPEARAENESPKKTETERALPEPPIERKREERIETRKTETRKREVREAEIVSQKKVKIPRRLRRDKRKTSVRVEFDIDERGEAQARVAESSGDRDLDEVVLKAARKTRFKPRTEDGVASKTTKKMRYDINVDDGDESSENDEEDE